MITLRALSTISDEELESKKQKILTDDDYNVLVTRATRLVKANGQPLLVYLPGAIDRGLLADLYPTLHSLRKLETDNRGMASGMPRVKRFKDAARTRTIPVSSPTLGALEAKGSKLYCRLTAWTGRETEKFGELIPLFQLVAANFAREVPTRYEAQMEYVQRTAPDWVVPGTPFTTITVNNTYPTGVHTDSGDLDQGFSTLVVLRRGNYTGGRLVFPEFRVAVDMQDGDLLLMDAHHWHGNTAIHCECGNRLIAMCDKCGAERISIVSYYRTEMVKCGTAEEESARMMARAERLIEQQAAEATGTAA